VKKIASNRNYRLIKNSQDSRNPALESLSPAFKVPQQINEIWEEINKINSKLKLLFENDGKAVRHHIHPTEVADTPDRDTGQKFDI